MILGFLIQFGVIKMSHDRTAIALFLLVFSGVLFLKSETNEIAKRLDKLEDMKGYWNGPQ
jgi:hypothetical protein